MPFVPKFTPSELNTIMESMKTYPPEAVQRDYATGQIPLKEKLHILQLYGAAQKEAAIRTDIAEAEKKTQAVGELGGGGYKDSAIGEAKYYAQSVFNEYKAAWDAATAEGGGKKSEAVFHAMMGSLNVLKAYDIPGDIIERWVLEKFPESPGFARAANWAVWLPTNFLGISTLLKAPFKAAEKAAKGAVTVGKAVAEEVKFLRDPVKYAVAQAKVTDAMMATKLAKATAENSTRKGAGVAGAAVAAEAKGGMQAFTTAEPALAPGVAQTAEKMLAPQDLEKMTVTELIKHYEERSSKMIRSNTEPFMYGGVSHETTRAAADASPLTFADIVARGPDAPISATELESIGRVHGEVSKGFNAIVDEAAQHLDDIRTGQRPDLVAAYKAHLAAMEISNPAFLSGRGQAGRALQYMGTLQDLVGESKVFDTITRSLGSEKLLDGSDSAIAYTISKVAALGNAEREQMVKTAASGKYEPGTLRLFFKSLLFWRPGIHVANVTGNTGSILTHGVNKVAAALDPASDVSLREAGAYFSGMWDTRNKFFELWQKSAENSSKSLAKAGIEGTATGNMVKYGPLGWLGFEDEIMGGVVGHGLAKEKAIKEGLTKWDEMREAVKAGALTLEPGMNRRKFLANHIESAMSDPHNYERLLSETEKEADYILFRSPLSRGGELGARFIRETPLDYFAPVVKFPINAMKMARDWTPGLQMLSKDFVEAVAEGGARADMVRSRMTLSWMMSSQVYEAAKAGVITGAGPYDPKANDAWRKAGNVPYSINGAPIKWIEPFGTWFGGIADFAQARAEMTDDNAENLFTAFMMAGAKGIENNYWLRIMNSVTSSISEVKVANDLNDILGSVGKVLLQPVKTVASLGTGARPIAEARNPENPDMRFYGELGDLKNWFLAGTIWGKDTRAKLNNSGQIEIIPPIMGAKWLQEHTGMSEAWARGIMGMISPPIREGGGERDPVSRFLDKHEVKLHDNWKYYGGSADPETPLPLTSAKPRVNLSGDQAYNWKFISLNDVREYGTNRTWGEAIQALDDDPSFAAKPQYEKQQEVNRLYASFRRDGIEALKKVDPDIVAKEQQRDLLDAQRKNQPGILHQIFGIANEVAQQPAPPAEPTAPAAVEYVPMEQGATQ